MHEVNYFDARPFRRYLEQECDAIAQRHGFVRRESVIHYLPRDGEILGDLRFPYTKSSITTLKRTSISPVLGIVHVEVASIKDEILNLDRKSPPGIQFGPMLVHLAPPPWEGYEVFVGQDNKEVFEQIEHDLVTYGLPWIEAHASLKSVIEETAPKQPTPEGYWFDYLIALGVDGQLGLLKERIEYQDAFCRASSVPGYKNYRVFLRGVAEYFGLSLDHPL